MRSASNDAVKVVVVKSALDKFFSAGADIKAFQANSTEDNLKMIKFAHKTLAKIAEIPKVFIAAIGGHALGGGLEMALACDLRTAGDGAYNIGLPEITLGLLPGNGGTQRLPRLIGRTTALAMMISGEPVSPKRAHELGIVDFLYPQETHLARHHGLRAQACHGRDAGDGAHQARRVRRAWSARSTKRSSSSAS